MDNGAGVAVMFTEHIVMRDNVFEHNWGPSSYGLLLKEIRDSEIRHNQFIGNTISNSRGIAIGSRGCTVANNNLQGRGIIAIQAGNASADNLKNGVHPQAADTLVQGNVGPLVIGNQYKPMPALNTTVRDHEGTVRLMLHQGTKL